MGSSVPNRPANPGWVGLETCRDRFRRVAPQRDSHQHVVNGLIREAVSDPWLVCGSLVARQDASGPAQLSPTRGGGDPGEGGPSPGKPRVASNEDGHQIRPTPRSPARAGDDPHRGRGGAARSAVNSLTSSAQTIRCDGVSSRQSPPATNNNSTSVSATRVANPYVRTLRQSNSPVRPQNNRGNTKSKQEEKQAG